MKTRLVKKHSAFLLCLLLVLIGLFYNCGDVSNYRTIDRFALVHRHLPDCRKADVLSPFTVGNGEFAFTVDVTGLQTLAAFYEQGIPLVTQSQWGWHTVPNTKGFRRSQTWEYMDTYDRVVPYASIMRSEAAEYLRSNPHRLNLGRIAFRKADSAFSEIQVSDISEIDQVLDIWTGKIHSFFVLDGKKITVQTCVHPDLDQIAVSVRASAPAVPAICFDFPYGSVQWGKNASDWDNPDRHTSSIIEKGNDYVTIERQLDSTRYYVYIRWNGNARLKTTGKHTFVLTNPDSRQLEFTCRFSPENEMTRENVTTTVQKSENFWRNFWLNGGAVDLSESRHPQALELERRIVLSQYLTAIQCSGSLPPQETGLTVNSWFGKFHLEMHWWHAVHFVLWGRPEMLENSLDWYTKILPRARKKALLQGYEGVRWPKMTSPDGLDSPSSVGVFLVWQQPHPIYYAELLYRSNPDDRILQQYKDIVFQTADFMASFAHWEEKFNRYVLGPPLIPAQEIYKPDKTMNPAFELSYWAFGLKTAQKWRERLGLAREEKWDHVLGHLAPLPANNGFFQNTETAQNTFQDVFNRNDHPTLLGAYGMLPNDNIDVEMMRRTLEQVMASWNWERTWGWDYPLTAMTAARVGRPDLAIQALLMDVPKNTYLNNGHNHQSERLPLYLPGNGGLLTAVAMMAAGWDGAPEKQTPGFPQDGEWTVKYEGLSPLP